MARSKFKLTHKETLGLTKSGRYSDGAGLYLVVRPSGTRSWSLRIAQDGDTKEFGLGSFPEVPLSKARALADEYRTQWKIGKDPTQPNEMQGDFIQHKNGDGLGFGEYALSYVASVTLNFRNPKHRQQWRNTLITYCEPIWRNPIATLNTDDVLSVLRPIWNTKPETARRVRGRMEAILSAAELEKLRPEGRNPAQWRGYLEHHRELQGRPKKAHHAALAPNDVPALYAALSEREAVSSLVLQFLILTAARSTEAREAEWSEINFDERAWTIPESRMKAHAEHRVPLSKQTLEILQPLSKIKMGKFIFPGQKPDRPLSETSMRNLLHKRMNLSGFTIHGMRTAFRGWATEIDRTPHDVAEAALAHRIPNAVQRAYDRTDRFELRREVMQRWADFVTDTALVDLALLNGAS